MKKIIKFFLRKWLFVLIIIIVAVAGFFFFNKNGQYETITVEAQNFVREISVVGTVIPAQETNMAFEMSGRVSAIYKKVGNRVNQGEQILSLESSDISSRLLRAQADYDAELAKLNKLENNNSTTDLTSIKNIIRSSYTVVDDAIRSKVDQFFRDPNDRFPEIKIFIPKLDTKIKVEEGRYAIGENLENLSKISKEITEITSITELKNNYVTIIKNDLLKILSFLDLISFALSTSEAGGNTSQSDLDKYSNDVSLARSNVDKAISDLNSAISNVTDTSQDIPYQEARVKSALANIKEIEALFSKNKITAPFSGVITKIDVEIGEIVGSSDSAVSIISDKVFQIETFVPEINIKDLKVGDSAKITLDAFGKQEIFDVEVISIEPAQTVRDGVSTYKTKFEFKEKNQKIRSGMTANVLINTENRPDVIVLPANVIYRRDGFDYVKVLINENVVEKQITIGNFDSVGNREIIAGVGIGEKIIKNPMNIK
jgi:multidrug efflux pump subunit AcrA (membrane-fusion protein)